MATIYRSVRPEGERYLLRWNSERGLRATKVFRTRNDADQYLAFIDERPSRRGKHTSGGRKREPLAERLQRNVVIDENGCWIWQRNRMKTEGYGLIGIRSDGIQRQRLAHRVSYETFIGTIPPGLQLDHLCRVRECVNPRHLEPVTGRENVLRSPIAQAAIHARQTHCIHGHEFTPENTYRTPDKGWRACRTCMRENGRRSYERRKAQKGAS